MDVIVIGAGQAGLAVSYLLTQAGIQHIVFERARIGDSWRSQRWDSFYLNTPNWSNNLPGMEFDPDAPDAFGHRDQIVSYLERYASSFDAPVRLGGQVVPGSIDWNAQALDLRFDVSDGETVIPVRSKGAPPAMFRDTMGVVVEGMLTQAGVFESTNLMVRHSNEYKAPPEGHRPVDVYETLIREEGET